MFKVDKQEKNEIKKFLIWALGGLGAVALMASILPTFLGILSGTEILWERVLVIITAGIIMLYIASRIGGKHLLFYWLLFLSGLSGILMLGIFAIAVLNFFVYDNPIVWSNQILLLLFGGGLLLAFWYIRGVYKKLLEK